VIGAMAHGVPCVLSPLAAEGIPVRDGVDARIAASPEAWVEALVALYTDSARWEAMSAAARATVERHFGFDAGVERMRGVLRQAGLYTPDRSTALLAR
jgi:glycosyltransferase involved in cell wall biosynthesis